MTIISASFVLNQLIRHFADKHPHVLTKNVCELLAQVAIKYKVQVSEFLDMLDFLVLNKGISFFSNSKSLAEFVLASANNLVRPNETHFTGRSLADIQSCLKLQRTLLLGFGANAAQFVPDHFQKVTSILQQLKTTPNKGLLVNVMAVSKVWHDVKTVFDESGDQFAPVVLKDKKTKRPKSVKKVENDDVIKDVVQGLNPSFQKFLKTGGGTGAGGLPGTQHEKFLNARAAR